MSSLLNSENKKTEIFVIKFSLMSKKCNWKASFKAGPEMFMQSRIKDPSKFLRLSFLSEIVKSF